MVRWVRVGDAGRVSAALAVAWLVLVCASCGGSGGGAESIGPGAAQGGSFGAAGAVESNPNVVSGDEIRSTGIGNLYDALRRLRPQWMRARGSASLVSPEATTPIVYLNGIRHGDLRTMQGMNVDQVRRVEFIDSRDATTRFGTGHSGGVISVDLDRTN